MDASRFPDDWIVALAPDPTFPCVRNGCKLALTTGYASKVPSLVITHNGAERFVTPYPPEDQAAVEQEAADWLRSLHPQPEQPKSRDYLRDYEY